MAVVGRVASSKATAATDTSQYINVVVVACAPCENSNRELKLYIRSTRYRWARTL